MNKQDKISDLDYNRLTMFKNVSELIRVFELEMVIAGRLDSKRKKLISDANYEVTTFKNVFSKQDCFVVDVKSLMSDSQYFVDACSSLVETIENNTKNKTVTILDFNGESIKVCIFDSVLDYFVEKHGYSYLTNMSFSNIIEIDRLLVNHRYKLDIAKTIS